MQDSSASRGGVRPNALAARRSFGEYARLFAKAIAVGVSDLVPGFSGGTMALVLGIYEELIGAIGSLSDREVWRSLLRGRVGEAFRAAHGAFLITVGVGILTAVVVLAPVASWLLSAYPVHVSAFFFGLVLASAFVAGSLVERWGAGGVALLLAGAVGAFVLIGLTPTTTPSGAWFLFLSGAVTVSALVLPGISGSFVLVLLSKYDVALAAVVALDLRVLVPLLLGAILGVISFARLLSYLLRRYHAPMMALLTGFVLGSLRKVWPYLGADGVTPVWPWAAAGPNPWALLALIVIGVGAVWLLERAGRLRSRSAPGAPA